MEAGDGVCQPWSLDSTTAAPSWDKSTIASPSPGASMAVTTAGYLVRWRLPSKEFSVELAAGVSANKHCGVLPLLWKLQGVCGHCRGCWGLQRQRMGSSITGQATRKHRISGYHWESPRFFFLAISRHLSYADLPSSPFCAVILHLLLLLLFLMFHCVAAGS